MWSRVEDTRSSMAHVDEQRSLLVHQDCLHVLKNARVYCESFANLYDLTVDAMSWVVSSEKDPGGWARGGDTLSFEWGEGTVYLGQR